ncbi:MAG: 50S ribosomal protein L29 [Candidatus Latescibacterota bacterium]|jgi:large subunit ribosomal protein L29|nr:MAG: 50S ribosomal protein L29 [Candidatus Latescibacterota bacterium]
MKTTELRDMTLAELASRAAELSEELARMRMQLALKRLDNPLKARTTRRDLARVRTIMNEKKRAGAAEAAGAADAGTKKA